MTTSQIGACRINTHHIVPYRIQQPGAPILLARLTHLQNLIEKIHRLGRVGNPSSRGREPRFKIVGTSAKELISHMQTPTALNPAKVTLTCHYAPGLVANVDKDIVAPVESAEGNALACIGHFENALDDQDSFFKLFPG